MRVVGLYSLLLIPYIPVGIVVILLRLAIFAHAYLASLLLCSCGAFKRFVLRTMCVVLGWVVSVNEEDLPSDEKLPIVSNHISLFDHLIIYLTSDCVTPNEQVFHWYASYQSSSSRSIVKLLERQSKGGWPVHIFPEKLTCSNPNSLSRFDYELFESVEKVQPVALEASRVFPIRLLELPINWISELVWQLFTPFTHYTVTYLEPMSRLVDETGAEFAERVRNALAHQLGIPTSPVTETSEQLEDRDQRKHLISRVGSNESSTSLSSVYPATSCDTTTRSSVASEDLDSDTNGLRPRTPGAKCSRPMEYRETNSNSISQTIDTSFDHLIPTIAHILNHIPKEQIRAALIEANGDVDTAIDFLLSPTDADGNDSSLSDSSAVTKPSDTGLVAPSRLKTAAETFHASSTARQASLTERRQALLSHARKRFLVTSNPEDSAE